MIRLLYRRSRLFRLLREKYSSLFTYTLMLFRVYYLAIADRLVEKGLLCNREDIYYLYDQEIRAFVAGESAGKEFTSLVDSRKEEIARCADAVLPDVIFGDNPPPINIQTSQRLTGTPTSRGYHIGRTKRVQGLGDFHKLGHGDVLVIPYSDMAWYRFSPKRERSSPNQAACFLTARLSPTNIISRR